LIASVRAAASGSASRQLHHGSMDRKAKARNQKRADIFHWRVWITDGAEVGERRLPTATST
jgi:hypothetical protein